MRHSFVAGAAGTEWTLPENRRALDDLHVLPQGLCGTSPDMGLPVDLPGRKLPLPVCTAPMGALGMVQDEAKVATPLRTG
ncbi:alpha-hydroxy-acid oxidizing protein [Paracoccus contaminans]|uniref:alpha-hydroxy-acid oxidizing protein n=1 Tax=Paracoccus contaminans TaxID=1945662 RepID=UPI00146E993F|nr:alpha-hydroxy-acid oxidizing protein [Paracoccus contaminans]